MNNRKNIWIIILVITLNLLLGNFILSAISHADTKVNKTIYHLVLSGVAVIMLIENASVFMKTRSKLKRILATIITAFGIPIIGSIVISFILSPEYLTLCTNIDKSFLKPILTILIYGSIFIPVGWMFWSPFALVNYFLLSRIKKNE